MKKFLRKCVPFGIILLMMLIFGATTEYFFTMRNLNSLLRDAAILGIIGVGITFVMLGGEIDLSVGSTMGLVMMVEARLLNSFHLTAAVSVAIGLMVGIACGLFNSLLVNRMKIDSFIATLANQMLLRGLVYLCSFHDAKGSIVTATLRNRVFMRLGAPIGDLYPCAIVWIVLVAASYFVLKKTKFGVYTYACGASENAARLSGINTKNMRRIFFVVAGFCAAVSGTFMLAWQGATTLDGGSGYEFNALVTMVVGGAFIGGVTDTIGTAAGSIFMILIVNGLYKYGIPSEYQYIVQGVLIIGLSAFSAVRAYSAARRAQKQAYAADLAAHGKEAAAE